MRDGPAPGWFVVASLATMAVLLLFLLLAVAVHRTESRPIPVRTHSGATWAGDTCYVDSSDVLWCGPMG